MDKIRLICSFLLLIIAIFSHAIRADMHYTTDPSSGLDWLNLSETANMAYNDAPSSFPGWRYAMNSEIEALFSTWFPAFVPHLPTGSADSFFTPYPGINDEARGFIEAFGPGYDDGTWLYAVGVYKDESDTLRPLGALAYPDYTESQVLGPEYVNLPIVGTDENPRYGIFLVRGATAPSDETPPSLVSVEIDPQVISTIDGAKEVKIDVSAADAESGVAHVEIFLDDPGSDVSDVGIQLSQSFSPAQPSVTANLMATFPVVATEGVWLLTGQIRDAAGNSTAIIGGSNGVPEGVQVVSSECNTGQISFRVGPYTNLSFGQAVDINSNYIHVTEPSVIRQMQREMNDYAGWDAELRSIDYAIYLSYCEMKDLKNWLNKGQYYVDQYNAHKETIEELIDTDLYIKIEKLKIYIAAIQNELGLSHYRELQELIRQADIRNYIRDNPDDAEVLLGAASDWLFIQSFVEYTAGVAKVTRVSVFATLLDIHNIIQDSRTIYQILFDENEVFDQYGTSFTELSVMLLEMQLLLEQYEDQRREYRRLIK